MSYLLGVTGEPLMLFALPVAGAALLIDQPTLGNLVLVAGGGLPFVVLLAASLLNGVRLRDGIVVVGVPGINREIAVSEVRKVREGQVRWSRTPVSGVVLQLDSGEVVPISSSTLLGGIRRQRWIESLKAHCGV